MYVQRSALSTKDIVKYLRYMFDKLSSQALVKFVQNLARIHFLTSTLPLEVIGLHSLMCVHIYRCNSLQIQHCSDLCGSQIWRPSDWGVEKMINQVMQHIVVCTM